MLANCLTRKGADKTKLMTVLKEGKLPRRERRCQEIKRGAKEIKKRTRSEIRRFSRWLL